MSTIKRLTYYWVPILLFLALHVMHVAPETSAPRQGELIGPDSYNRLNRVDLLHDSGQWFNDWSARSNAPYGVSEHYTRPLDTMLLAGAWLLSVVTDFRDALFWTGSLISPLLQFCALFGLIWALSPILNRRHLILIGLLFLVQPTLSGHFYVGRADHHSLFVFLFVLSIGLILRLLIRQAHAPTAIAAGLVAALSMWASVEAMVPLFVNVSALVLFWIFDDRNLGPKLRLYGGALFAGMATMLIAERSFAGAFDIAYDRISMVHVLLAGLVFGFGLATAAVPKLSPVFAKAVPRLSLTATWGVISLAVVWALYPRFFDGPYADLDPRVRPIWLDHIQDAQPLLFGAYHSYGGAVSLLGFAVLALPVLVFLSRRSAAGPMRDLAVYLLIGVAVFLPLTFAQGRVAGYTAILLLSPYAIFIARAIDWVAARSRGPLIRIWRPLVVIVFAVGFTALGAILQQTESPKVTQARPPACQLSDVADIITAYPPGQERTLTILASGDYGPELLYRTPHRVIGTPYRRNAAGLLAVHDFFSAADDDSALRIAVERRIDLAVLCPGTQEPNRYRPAPDAEGLYHRLLAGTGPAWLAEVAVPTDLRDSMRLFAVSR